MKKNISLKLSLLACVISFVAGCVVEPRPAAVSVGAEVDVGAAPPPPVVEEVYPAPEVGFVWIGGAWAWHDHWVWERGHWDRPPHPGAVWVPHQYAYRNGRHVFVPGRWR